MVTPEAMVPKAINPKSGVSVFLFQSPQPQRLRPHLLHPLESSPRPYQHRRRTTTGTDSRRRPRPASPPRLAARRLCLFHHHRLSLADPVAAQSDPPQNAPFANPPTSARRRFHGVPAHLDPSHRSLSKRALLDHRVPTPASAGFSAMKRLPAAHAARIRADVSVLLSRIVATLPSNHQPAPVAKKTGNKI